MLRKITYIINKFFNLPIFQFENGRQKFSLWVSKIFEKKHAKRILGVNLIAAMFLTGVIFPQVDNALAQKQVENDSISQTDVNIDPVTKTTFDMPLVDFNLSQSYSFFHPGIDMAAPLGSPIYAIADGFVEYTGDMIFGYGKHVIVAHDHGFKSLYGHMSEIKTIMGRKVMRGELIGRVGSTGWATGNHLHLEIYLNGQTIDPMSALPIKPEEIKYDGIYGKIASPSSTLVVENK